MSCWTTSSSLGRAGRRDGDAKWNHPGVKSFVSPRSFPSPGEGDCSLNMAMCAETKALFPCVHVPIHPQPWKSCSVPEVVTRGAATVTAFLLLPSSAPWPCPKGAKPLCTGSLQALLERQLNTAFISV